MNRTRKNDPPPEDPVAPGDSTNIGSLNADSISNHLQFMNAIGRLAVFCLLYSLLCIY